MKPQLKEHLAITKREWNGLVVLSALIALTLTLPYLHNLVYKDDTVVNINEFNKAVAELEKANLPGKDIAPAKLNKFNPNTASTADWQKMGLTAKQAATIKNYVSKGGRFRKAEDLQKIYGLTKIDYVRLAPFMIIPDHKPAVVEVIEINTADSATLTRIQGVGPAFAKRIIYYRQRLGGFVSKEQLKEVFGLDELKYDEIKGQVKVNPRLIRRLDINTITFDKLRLMPYLNYKQVNAVIEYRNQHGSYTSVDDLKNIAIIDEQILRKIEPYLIFK
ncbi:ComEA family DNA-binding protein [Mucilaginibacter litoreus]|uniref:ComEA family DNA-binding protein n=1 Tax=Mucilaginibacter litoreus TaxID=1048221 RepID=A0ABW3ANS4_9SPHI